MTQSDIFYQNATLNAALQNWSTCLTMLRSLSPVCCNLYALFHILFGTQVIAETFSCCAILCRDSNTAVFPKHRFSFDDCRSRRLLRTAPSFGRKKHPRESSLTTQCLDTAGRAPRTAKDTGHAARVAVGTGQ